MKEPPPNVADRLAARITVLEELFSHIERTVYDLDQALQTCQQRIDGLERQAARQTAALAALAEPPEPPRDLADERPPHY